MWLISTKEQSKKERGKGTRCDWAWDRTADAIWLFSPASDGIFWICVVYKATEIRSSQNGDDPQRFKPSPSDSRLLSRPPQHQGCPSTLTLPRSIEFCGAVRRRRWSGDARDRQAAPLAREDCNRTTPNIGGLAINAGLIWLQRDRAWTSVDGSLWTSHGLLYFCLCDTPFYYH